MSDVQDSNSGWVYWRNLEEYANSPEFQDRLSREFESYDPDEILSMSRRGFMKLAGASMALAGLTLSGCRRWPKQELVPFAHRPAGRTPGEPEYYATMSERHGVATGLLVESFDGRPIKIEGNPQHPYSLGATDPMQQAATLTLYDPDRSRNVRVRAQAAPAGETSFGQQHQRSSWERFERFAQDQFRGNGRSQRLAVLSQATGSPSAARLKGQLLKQFPQARWFEYEPVNRDEAHQGSRMVFGRALRPVYDLSGANVIICFDCDLLNKHPASLRSSRQWAEGRRAADTTQTMNRMYVVESSFTCTGSVADERLPVRSSQIEAIVRAMAGELGIAGAAKVAPPVAVPFWQQMLDDVKSAQAAGGRSVVMAGPTQPAEVHALVWQINAALGNLGKTITLAEEPDQDHGDIGQLTQAMHAGQVDALLILGGNPVYDAPADLNFASALQQVEHSVHLSQYFDETSNQCQWHLPRAHWLEAWGDGRAWDGTLSVQQPLIRPLFDGKTSIEVLATLMGRTPHTGYDIVRETVHGMLGQVQNFEDRWRKLLHDGLLEGSGFKQVQAQPSQTAIKGRGPRRSQEHAPRSAGQAAQGAGGEAGKANAPEVSSFEVTFQADPALFDGRYANNGWLQELPGPLTKLTWDNAAWLNIADARAHNVREGDIVTVQLGDRQVEIPAFLMPGQARGSITLPLGYGRTAPTMTIARGVGADVYPLRTTSGMGFAHGATLSRTGGYDELANTQHNHLVDMVARYGLNTRVGHKGESGLIVREASLEEYQADPDFAHEVEPGNMHLQMYQPISEYVDPHAWGLSIDMSACMGCSACMIACQAENNVPVVGKAGVNHGREMHWLRIDRYFKSNQEEDPNAEHPDIIHQPMMCVQCENAPCEEVCPVAATMHDSEGINVMVYNRCIGVRYCSNNCPYKVRRFNFFDWHSKPIRADVDMPWPGFPDEEQNYRVNPLKELVHNPDVTVRMRGVMEKCNYCLQRIKRAEIKAKREYLNNERDTMLVHDGEIVTACQQACPTNAIVFGNLNDNNSRVSELHRNTRAYAVLKALNTRPRTRHLAKIRNPAKA